MVERKPDIELVWKFLFGFTSVTVLAVFIWLITIGLNWLHALASKLTVR